MSRDPSAEQARDDYWNGLRVLAETHNDLMVQRIGVNHRIKRAPIHRDALEELAGSLKAAETRAARFLKVEFRKSGFAPWAKETPGLGEHTVARLLGAMGDPAIRAMPDGSFQWRTVSQLWSLCGRGDATRKKRKGMTQEDAMALGNPYLKMLTHLIAECATKESGRSVELWRETGSFGEGEAVRPLRRVYEARRIATADREGWSDGRKHNDALRIVAKEMLKDLWKRSRAMHGV